MIFSVCVDIPVNTVAHILVSHFLANDGNCVDPDAFRMRLIRALDSKEIIDFIVKDYITTHMSFPDAYCQKSNFSMRDIAFVLADVKAELKAMQLCAKC